MPFADGSLDGLVRASLGRRGMPGAFAEAACGVARMRATGRLLPRT